MDVQSVNYLRDELRDLEARLEATPPGSEGRYDLMAEVARKRGIWRQAEVLIGRRVGGIGVALQPQTITLSGVLDRLTKAG